MYVWIASYFNGQLDDWRVARVDQLEPISERHAADGWTLTQSPQTFTTYDDAESDLAKQGYSF